MLHCRAVLDRSERLTASCAVTQRVVLRTEATIASTETPPIVLDGAHVMGEDGRVRFQALPAPTGEERRAWTEEIASRVTRLLRRRGLLDGDDARCDEAPSALQACQAASGWPDLA